MRKKAFILSNALFISACGSNPLDVKKNSNSMNTPTQNRLFALTSPDVHVLASANQRQNSRKADKSRTELPLLSSMSNIAVRALSITSKKILGASLAMAVYSFHRFMDSMPSHRQPDLCSPPLNPNFIPAPPNAMPSPPDPSACLQARPLRARHQRHRR